jgi:hypothetical protein
MLPSTKSVIITFSKHKHRNSNYSKRHTNKQKTKKEQEQQEEKLIKRTTRKDTNIHK